MSHARRLPAFAAGCASLASLMVLLLWIRPSQAQPALPRCQSVPGAQPARVLCLRHAAASPEGVVRAAVYDSQAPTSAASLTVQIADQPLSGTTQRFADHPVPLRLMVVVQLPAGGNPEHILAQVRALQTHVLATPGSQFGVLAYGPPLHEPLLMPPSARAEDLVDGLQRLQKKQSKRSGAGPSLSWALAQAMAELDKQPVSPMNMEVLLALTDGTDNDISPVQRERMGGVTARMTRRQTVLDILFAAAADAPRPASHLANLVLATGGMLSLTDHAEHTTGGDSLHIEKYVQMLAELRLFSGPVPSSLARGTTPHRLGIRSPDAPGIVLSKSLIVHALPPPPVPPEAPAPMASSPPPSKAPSLAASALWWWLSLLLLAAAGGLFALPDFRALVRQAVLSELPPLVGPPAVLPTLTSTPLEWRSKHNMQPAGPARAATWIDAYQQPQATVSWFLALQNGRVYWLDKPEFVLGSMLPCDILLSSQGPAKLLCHMHRDEAGRMVLRPDEGTTAERNGQLITSAVHLVDQDELAIGTQRFRYFETRWAM